VHRRALIMEGARAAADARDQGNLDQFAPIDIYALVQGFGIDVRFLDVSMEGCYYKGPPTRIIVSALRPLGRRAHTCAHEFGHHWFGHGSTLHELQMGSGKPSQKPEEVLAEAFAAFVLTPTVGIRSAFARRGWAVETANPVQVYTIACEYGVGFSALVTHLAYALRDLTAGRRAELERWTPQRIRRLVLGYDEQAALVILDQWNEARTVDLEVGDLVALPPD
jgi:IrrE N-terminal-like domain